MLNSTASQIEQRKENVIDTEKKTSNKAMSIHTPQPMSALSRAYLNKYVEDQEPLANDERTDRHHV